MIKIIKESDQDSANIAANHLQKGGVIAFATDTVYGLGVDASSEVAVQKLYALKKRDEKKAVAVLFKNLARAKELLKFSERALSIAQKFLPGPLTIILPLKDNQKNLANNLNIIDSSIGFRIVDKLFINNLFEIFQGDIALTSANLSKESVLTNAQDIFQKFSKTKLDLLVIDGGELKNNLASSVVKINNDTLEILREGIIGKESFL